MIVACPSCQRSSEISAEQLASRSHRCPACGASLTHASTATLAYATADDPADGPPLPRDILKPGDILGGYEVERLLGSGGMGAVYVATQKSLGRRVALKILSPRFASSSDFVQRFEREAAALAALSHPNIVAIIDKGVQDGRYFFAMELVDGVSLRELILRRALDAPRAARLFPPLCDALEYAHAKGVIHRDIKPENILVSSSGIVKVADFGLARLTAGEHPAATPITMTQTVMGTRDYMAPEARQSARQCDHRADIYSLGVVLYETLTGELPIGRFEMPSRMAGVDARFDDVIVRSLEADPAHRYQRASEVGHAISEITGAPAVPSGVVPAQAVERSRLARVADGRVLGGVCAGIGRRFGWEPLWPRLLLALLTGLSPLASLFAQPGIDLVFGSLPAIPILSYLFLWIFLPRDDRPSSGVHPRLARPRRGGALTGVCAGIAARYGFEVLLVRLAFLAGAFVGGLGILAYLFCWAVMPAEGAPPNLRTRIAWSLVAAAAAAGVWGGTPAAGASLVETELIPEELPASVLEGLTPFLPDPARFTPEGRTARLASEAFRAEAARRTGTLRPREGWDLTQVHGRHVRIAARGASAERAAAIAETVCATAVEDASTSDVPALEEARDRVRTRIAEIRSRAQSLQAASAMKTLKSGGLDLSHLGDLLGKPATAEIAALQAEAGKLGDAVGYVEILLTNRNRLLRRLEDRPLGARDALRERAPMRQRLGIPAVACISVLAALTAAYWIGGTALRTAAIAAISLAALGILRALS